MINSNMRTYDFYTYGNKNEYGQDTLSNEAQGSIKIAIYNTSQSIQDNIRYRDAAYVGLTHDKNVNDSYVIQYGNEKLKVLYVNTLGRFRQVFLKNI